MTPSKVLFPLGQVDSEVQDQAQVILLQGPQICRGCEAPAAGKNQIPKGCGSSIWKDGQEQSGSSQNRLYLQEQKQILGWDGDSQEAEQGIC